MAKLTRKQVIARVKAGKSLAGKDLSELDLSRANLSGANLCNTDLRGSTLHRTDLRKTDLSKTNLSKSDLWHADLCEANLCGSVLMGARLSESRLVKANLSGADLNGARLRKAKLKEADLRKTNLCGANLRGADLNGANLREANLRESKLDSANFEDADLSGADLTGANIWNIATADWKIEGVKCDYIYNSKYHKGYKKTRRDFKPGEFEQIYKSFPKLELIFKEKFSHLDHRALLAVIDRINEELPNANLNLRKIERTGNDTSATLSAETKEAIEEIVKNSLQKHYSKVHDELKALKGVHALHNNPSLLPKQVSDLLNQQLQEIAEQPPDRLLNLNFNVFVGNEFRGQMEIGKQTVTIYQTQIINMIDRLESSNFDDAELKEANKEFQAIYKDLDRRQKTALSKQTKKIIAEKVKKRGFNAKLKKLGKRVVEEGLDVGKGVLTNILTECARGLV